FWMDLRITNAGGTTTVSQPARKEVLPSALTDYAVSEMRERKSWAVVTDRTVDEARPIVVIAAPIEKGGAVIARIDGAAINKLFDSIELSQQALISVLDSSGRILFRRRGSEATTEADMSWAPLASVLGEKRTNVIELTSPVDGIKRVYGIAHVRDTGLIAMIGIPSATLYEPARQRFNRYGLVGLLALLLAIGAALVIERSIVTPVRSLRSTAQQLGAGDLTARAQTKDAGEIGDLAKAFNRMADRVEEREERLTELDQLKSDFVSSVSHELKTPLTTIKVLAHLLQGRALAEDDRLDYSRTIATECDRQIEFVGNLLDLSRIESGAYKLTKSPVDVARLINSCVDVDRHRSSSMGLVLTTKMSEGLPKIEADFEALCRVIRGLVDNAIKYTPEGGRVTVSAHIVGQEVAISVEDNGSGIHPEDLPHVFDKFFRASSRTENDADKPALSATAAPGVGLGLYLAKHIVEQLGGRIEVKSEVGAGTVLTLLMPALVTGGNSEMAIEDDADVEAIAGS
ncbi:MAG TPA: ATP-binding protein, partial [Pyrinomonadaceae bacterium]